MLEQLLTELRNWFRVRDAVDGKHPGTYTVENGGIVLPFLKNGQFFRVIGSDFSDGLYIYGETITDENHNEVFLPDDTFYGSIWALAIPRVILQLAKEKAEIEAKIADATASFAESGFVSESFGAYSYTKDRTGQLSTLNARRDEIMKQLNQYRKIRED